MLGMHKSETAVAKWSRIIAAQRSSGLSVTRFCEERGIAASSFFAWKRRLAGAAPARAFVEATVLGVDDGHRLPGEEGGVGTVGGVAIELSRGRRVLVGRGFDRQLLLEVIEAIEAGAGAPGGRA